MSKAYKAMDLCMLHLGAKGRLNLLNFQRRSKGRPKKKRAKRQIFKNHKMRNPQMRFTPSRSDFGEGGALQRVNK